MLKDHSNIDHGFKLKLVELLKDLQHEDGGFRGAPKGVAHISSTCIAVLAIIDLGIPEAYDIIDIPKMRNYLLKMKNTIFKNKESSLVDKNAPDGSVVAAGLRGAQIEEAVGKVLK